MTDPADKTPLEPVVAIPPTIDPDESTPVRIELDYQSPTPRLWSVGTLTYTGAGLAMVIMWLLLGTLGTAFRDRAYPNSFILMLKKFNPSNTAVVFLTIILPQCISLIFNPIISYRSDRFRSRWGRRIPFIFLSAPIATLAMVGLAFSPDLVTWLDRVLGSHSPGTNRCALIVFGVLAACFNLGVVFAVAVFNGLVNDVVPREKLGRFFGLHRIVGLICGVTFNFWILGLVEVHFRTIFLGIALLFFATLLLLCFTVKEGEYPPPPELLQIGPTWGQEILEALQNLWSAPFLQPKIDAFRWLWWVLLPPKVREYIVECFSHPHYRWIFAALALGGLTVVPVNAFSLLYAKSLGVPTGTYGKMLATNHICGMLIAYPIGALVDRFHSLRISIATMALYGLTVLLGGIFIQGPQTFLGAAFGHMFMSGVYLTASLPLAQMLLPRLKFAQFFSASVLLTSVLVMTVNLSLAKVLDQTSSNYRLTYITGFALAMTTVVVMLVVYRKFMALGGPKGYVAPDEDA